MIFVSVFFSLYVIILLYNLSYLWRTTPRELAGISGWLEMRGRKLDTETFSPNMKLNNGEFILIDAIQFSAPEQVIRDLLALGANPNACSCFGVPAVCYAVEHGWLSVVRAMVDAGADLNAMDRDGNNAAFYTEDPELLKSLGEMGCVLSAQNAQGKTILFRVSNLPQAMTLMRLGVDGALRDRHGNRASIVSDFEVFPKVGGGSADIDINPDCLYRESILDLLERGADPNRCFEMYVQNCPKNCLEPGAVRLLFQAGLVLSDNVVNSVMETGNTDIFALLCQFGSESEAALVRKATKLDLPEIVMHFIRKNKLLSDEDYLELINNCIYDNRIKLFSALLDERFKAEWVQDLIGNCFLFHRGEDFIQYIRMKEPKQVEMILSKIQKNGLISM